MSDEPIRIVAEAAPAPAGIWEHRCEHPGCADWGGWGYQIGRQSTHWYCHDHRDEGERLIGRG